MELTGSEILVQCLREQGVDTVFGYPGGCILNVYDALYKHSDEITHIYFPFLISVLSMFYIRKPAYLLVPGTCKTAPLLASVTSAAQRAR